MSTNATRLVKKINTLFELIHLAEPAIQSPVDLTPSLLLAILNALPRTHLPLASSPRPYLFWRTTSQPYYPQLQADQDTHHRIQTAKLVLGVLETDVLQTDVGLSSLDPRRLASGEWDEVVFIAELLCWVAVKIGLKLGSGSERPSAHSPETTTTTTTTWHPSSTSFRHHSTESNTSVPSGFDLDMSQSLSRPPSPHPRCIHEVPSPSLVLSADLEGSFPDPTPSEDEYCDCPSPYPDLDWQPRAWSPKQAPPVRYTGYISPVDEELEILSFESSRNASTHRRRNEKAMVGSYFVSHNGLLTILPFVQLSRTLKGNASPHLNPYFDNEPSTREAHMNAPWCSLRSVHAYCASWRS